LFLGTKVNVEYMYAVAGANLEKAVMVFHFNAIDQAIAILEKSGAKLLDAKSFGILVGQE
jgi:hypothetical protein